MTSLSASNALDRSASVSPSRKGEYNSLMLRGKKNYEELRVLTSGDVIAHVENVLSPIRPQCWIIMIPVSLTPP